MQTVVKKLRTIQNIGFVDRIIRGVIAVLVIGLPPLALVFGGSVSWHGYVILLGIYPALTAILGWDPFYVLFNVRSCGSSRRNRCGTFPFEVNAALGRNTSVDKDHNFDHSMSAVHLHDPAWKDGTLSAKNRNRALAISTGILALAVIAYLTMQMGIL